VILAPRLNILSHKSGLFSPDKLGDRVACWYSQDGLAESGSVSSWQDQSGNNFHAVQPSPSLQPAVVAGRAHFDGIDDFLDISNAGGVFRAKTHGYIFAAAQTTGLGHVSHYLAYFSVPGTGSRFTMLAKWTTGRMESIARTTDASTTILSGGPIVQTTFGLMESHALWGDGRVGFAFNGGELTEASFPPSPTSDTDSTNRRIGNLGPNTNFQGSLAEMLVVNAPLTDLEILKIRRYFARRHSLPISL
jgi:hypothetical protein